MPHDPTLTAARILIADDQQLIVRVLERVLQGDGYYDVRSTNDPRQAVELARALRPDLMLLDLNMAPIDGIEVMRQALALVSPQPTVLFLTGSATHDAIARARAAGAWEVLTKPFDKQALLDHVEEALAQRILQEGASSLPEMPSLRLGA